jgi:hypothetical protein
MGHTILYNRPDYNRLNAKQRGGYRQGLRRQGDGRQSQDVEHARQLQSYELDTVSGTSLISDILVQLRAPKRQTGES